jgi:hypothetical protein
MDPELAARKADHRKQVLERVSELAMKGHRQRLARAQGPDWTDAEHHACIEFCDMIKAGLIKQQTAVNQLVKLLPGRSYEAIRKKLKNYINHGTFTPTSA